MERFSRFALVLLASSGARTAPTPSLSPRALDAEPSLAPSRAGEPGPGAEIELEIVDAAGQPLAGAELRFAVEDERSGIVDDPSTPSGKRKALRPTLPPRAYDVERALAHRPTVVAGAGGKVPLAWPGGRGLLVEARHGELWGFRWFPRDWRETEGSRSFAPPRLELVPDWALRVRVEDAAGRLVPGLPVHVRGEGWSQNLDSRAEEELVVEHVGFLAHGAPGRIAVSVGAFVDPPATVRLETRRAPDGPVTLRVPPLGAVEVLVLAPDGRPARSEFVELRFFDPGLEFVTPWPRVDLELFVPGYRSVALRAFGGRAEIALEPGLPVRLRLVTTGVLPAPPRDLHAVLVPVGEARVGIDWEGPAFGPTRELVTLAWGPGRMKVEWIVAEHGADGSQGGGIVREATEAQYVVLVDTTAEQVFELTLSAEDLARFFPDEEGG